MKREEIQDKIASLRNRENELESNLRQKDYIGTKIAMGVATREDYAEEITLTEEWRTQLRATKEEIARLEKEEPEDETPEPEAEE